MAFVTGAVIFVFSWLLICALLSIVGGWFWFARSYPYPKDRQFENKVVFGSLSINWLFSYRRCITVGADAEGLSLRPILPFRFMHPPIFIPWTEMGVAQTGRLLWMYVFEFVPSSGAPVVQLYESAATLAKAKIPFPTGTGAWRAIVIQNIVALGAVIFIGMCVAKNIHITHTSPIAHQYRAPIIASAVKNSLKPPLSKLAWTLGNWECTSTNWDMGTPEAIRNAIYFRAVPDASGRAIDYSTASRAYSDEGRMAWNASKSTFTDQTIALTEHGPMQSASVMKQSDVTDTSFTFTGTIKAATYEAVERVTTSRTGLNSFSVSTAYWLKGQWKRVDTDSCLRIQDKFNPISSSTVTT
jgi:hypothetical protein